SCTDTATTRLSTLSLHDALPILHALGSSADSDPVPHHQPGHYRARRGTLPLDPEPGLLASGGGPRHADRAAVDGPGGADPRPARDRKSTRLNSSHVKISYAVFCL